MSKKRQQENGVTTAMILITIFSTVFVFLLAFPNIYLDNHIYYESRELAHLNRVKIILEEEQVIIKNKLEKINVEDNFFNED